MCGLFNGKIIADDDSDEGLSFVAYLLFTHST